MLEIDFNLSEVAIFELTNVSLFRKTFCSLCTFRVREWFYYKIIIIIKLLQDKDPMEQSDSRHSTIAAFNSDPFEVQIKYLYGIFLPKYTFYT